MTRTKLTISYEMQKLGNIFKELRKERDLSIRQVAKECGIAPSYLAKIEAGNTFKTIGVETLVKLCKFFKIPCNVVLKKANYIQENGDGLPDFAEYLQEKFDFPQAAVHEMEIAKTIIATKYRLVDSLKNLTRKKAITVT